MEDGRKAAGRALSMKVLTEETLKKNVELSKYTTFGIGGPAQFMVEPRTMEELREALDFAESEGLKVLPLGGGSDILLPDSGFRGLVIRFSRLSNVEIRGRRMVCEAGVYLQRLLNLAAKEGLSGLEPLAGIPGQLGGAIAKNAGSYGREIVELVRSVTILTWDGEIVDTDTRELSIVYRGSRIPDLGLVVRVTLELAEGDPEKITAETEKFLERRKKEQPYGIRSAGCVFKNPENAEPAGYLLDKAGLKGFRIGDAAYSDIHANFIVNEGNASYGDIIRLIEIGKERVKDEFGVSLEEEIVVVQDD